MIWTKKDKRIKLILDVTWELSEARKEQKQIANYWNENKVDLKVQIAKYWNLNGEVKRCSRRYKRKCLEAKADEGTTILNARDRTELRKLIR